MATPLPRRATARRSHSARLWEDAWRRWQAERQHRADSTVKREDALLRWLRPRLARRPLERITRAHLADIRSDALKAGWGPRSVNYATGLVTAVLRAAVEWGWILNAPRLKPLRIPHSRVRWISPGEARRLVARLPEHLADLAEFTLETGLRKATATRLEWTMVDWSGSCLRIPAAMMKQRIPLSVPLSDVALQILRRRVLLGGCWVFSYRGKRIGEPGGRVWREILDELGIVDFHWHDLRHTWASWHVQSGTPLAVLKELGGWKTLQMVMVYAHLNTDQLNAAASSMTQWRARGLS